MMDRQATGEIEQNAPSFSVIMGQQGLTKIPPLPADFFQRARVRMPKQRVTVQIDADLLQWFQSQGDDCERRMNAALRLYVEAHKAA